MSKRHTSSPAVRGRLRALPGFDELPESTLARIDAVSTDIQVEAGHKLTRQGSPGREAFVITSGAASVWRDGTRVADLTAGGLVGELALLDGGPRTADVIAETPLHVLVVDPGTFASLCEDAGFRAWVSKQVLAHAQPSEETTSG